jgi:hypothetical protein
MFKNFVLPTHYTRIYEYILYHSYKKNSPSLHLAFNNSLFQCKQLGKASLTISEIGEHGIEKYYNFLLVFSGLIYTVSVKQASDPLSRVQCT